MMNIATVAILIHPTVLNNFLLAKTEKSSLVMPEPAIEHSPEVVPSTSDPCNLFLQELN
jgi:hypothetical protein